MSEKALWQIIHEAVSKSCNEVVEISEIRSYIEFNYPAKYNKIHPGTINAQVTYCCVNQQSRVNFPGNDKERIANSKYDFLYRVGRGQITLYKPEIHGQWEIAKIDDKFVVRHVNKKLGVDFPNNKQPKMSSHTKRSKTMRDDIPRPSVEQVKFYLDKWNLLESYTANESELNRLFWDRYPTNDVRDEILNKVAILDKAYSTHLKSIFDMATHIFQLKIDDRLQSGDESLVSDIANLVLSNGSPRIEYSFATKYCSHHRANDYPIYDSYVEKLLLHSRDVDGFAKFHKKDLRNFSIFKQVILEFRKFYSLENFSIKEIDRYLWLLGKEKFPKGKSKK